jgi:hypothetical protein
VKVQKQELEKITQDAAKIGLLMFVCLVSLHCDVAEVYEVVERFLNRTEALRKNLGLENIVPEGVTKGLISAAVRKAESSKSKEEKDSNQEMVDVQELLGKEIEGNPELEQKFKDMFTGVVNKNVN